MNNTDTAVRYLVNDVQAAVDFYTTHLGFTLIMNAAPAIAQIAALGIRQTGDGPKPPRKRPPFGGLRVKKSYLERETGFEPATLCLEARVVGILAAPDATGQFPPQNEPFWASDSGHAEHLIEVWILPCRFVKPSDRR